MGSTCTEPGMMPFSSQRRDGSYIWFLEDEEDRLNYSWGRYFMYKYFPLWDSFTTVPGWIEGRTGNLAYSPRRFGFTMMSTATLML
jgi:hypothetical protein